MIDALRAVAVGDAGSVLTSGRRRPHLDARSPPGSARRSSACACARPARLGRRRRRRHPRHARRGHSPGPRQASGTTATLMDVWYSAGRARPWPWRTRPHPATADGGLTSTRAPEPHAPQPVRRHLRREAGAAGRPATSAPGCSAATAARPGSSGRTDVFGVLHDVLMPRQRPFSSRRPAASCAQRRTRRHLDARRHRDAVDDVRAGAGRLAHHVAGGEGGSPT